MNSNAAAAAEKRFDWPLCYDAEQLVLARTDGDSVVVRPTIVYGVGDTRGMLARAASLLERGITRFPGTGANNDWMLASWILFIKTFVLN